MTEDLNGTGPEPDWPAIRLRYEAGAEKVADIAASIGWFGINLSRHAKKQGWALRGKAAAPAENAPPNDENATPKPAKAETTAQTLQRLKDILTRRIAHLEGDIGQMSEEAKTLNTERDIRSANTLVRTLEKVLELEQRERKNRAKRARESARLNDAERDELARRIVGLCRTGQGTDVEPGAQDHRGEEAAVGMAAVGAGGSTSAAR